MRILICDEDTLIIEQLQKYIKTYFKNNHLKCPKIVCYSDGNSLLADSGEKDILFLDIVMKNSNGISIGSELKTKNKNLIIFIVTAFTEYLDDAIDLYNSITPKIPIETKKGVYTCTASSIIFIEASNRQVIVHSTSRKFKSLHNMIFWIEHLPKNLFFQSHRSFIVNFEHIMDFDHTLIHLSNNNIAYLTRRKYSSFKEAYLLYLKSKT